MKIQPVTLALVLIAMAAMATGCTTSDSGDSIPGYTMEPPPPPPATVDSLLPFSRGVNFSTWFEAPSPSAIPFTRFTEQDFIDVKSLGADVIRLPINLHSMTGGAPDYILDPLFLRLLDQAVNWAEQHKLYLILDNHSFDPVANTDPEIGNILVPVWTQLARHYKDRSEYVLYEVLNEPHGIDANLWAGIQGNVIKAIREIDHTHSIVAGGAGFNSIDELDNLPTYDYDNIIYAFHFYDPYLFTHQGETWGSPPNLKTLAGLPFPADAHDLPLIPDDLKRTWVEDSVRYSYKRDASVAALANKLDKAVQFSRERGNLPLLCGEFGVYIPNSFNEDRVRWYQLVTTLLDDRNIARTSWDYFNGFGIFKSGNGGLFTSGLNVEVVQAMGFKAPPQTPAEKIRNDFSLFDDYPGSIVARIDHWAGNLNLYHENAGKYAINWNNADQYGTFLFTFKQEIDWEYLKAQNYAISFRAKADKPASFDVRFVDRDDGANIPWRMNYSVDIPANGEWHNVEIPLASMREQGAWINTTETWLTPEGKFSWSGIANLSFVAETGDLHGVTVLFDSIKLEQ